MELVVLQKTQYGQIRFYPVNDTAQKFADLMGRMTFDVGHLKRIKEIGLPVKISHEEVVL
jgi:hypothetical protein